MRNKIRAVLLSLMIGLLMSVPNASGAQAATPNGEILTDETLKQMVTGLGYSPKTLKQGFVISFTNDGFTVNVQLLLSPNKRKVGLNANLGTVANPKSIPSERWLGLLESNTDTAPSFMYFQKSTNKLLLHRVFDNRAVTPAILKDEIERFSQSVITTAPLWKFAE